MLVCDFSTVYDIGHYIWIQFLCLVWFSEVEIFTVESEVGLIKKVELVPKIIRSKSCRFVTYPLPSFSKLSKESPFMYVFPAASTSAGAE